MTARLLTERELSERLGLSPDTLRRMRRAGEIPYVALSRRRVAYREDEIDRWLEARTVREQEPDDGPEDRATEIMADLTRAA